jgi:predicted acetyltransferase
MEQALRLLPPALDLLDGYSDALRRGWSANNLRDTSTEELAAIAAGPERFLAVLRGEVSGSVLLPDGRDVPRLPGFTRWMWDGEFCGAVNLRYLPGRQDLPAHVTGHVGYAVVPWKRRRGYATQALGVLLPLAAAVGLGWLDATVDPDNEPSRRVLLAHGATQIGTHGSADGQGGQRLLFRIPIRQD